MTLDFLRGMTVVFNAVIFFAWVVIMVRSLVEYVQVRRTGKKASIRLHIWSVTFSYLILVAGATSDIIENRGGPLEEDDLVLSLPAAILGGIAVLLFLRQGRTTVRAGEETDSLGLLIATSVVVGVVAVVLALWAVLG